MPGHRSGSNLGRTRLLLSWYLNRVLSALCWYSSKPGTICTSEQASYYRRMPDQGSASIEKVELVCFWFQISCKLPGGTARCQVPGGQVSRRTWLGGTGQVTSWFQIILFFGITWQPPTWIAMNSLKTVFAGPLLNIKFVQNCQCKIVYIARSHRFYGPGNSKEPRVEILGEGQRATTEYNTTSQHRFSFALQSENTKTKNTKVQNNKNKKFHNKTQCTVSIWGDTVQHWIFSMGALFSLAM